MNTVMLIARRELNAYVRTMSGYIIIAVMLFIDGLVFNAYAVPGVAKKSSEIVADFFSITSVVTLFGSVFLSMRLLAEERQSGTITLLYSSPVKDYQIVLGKFLSAMGFMGLFLLGTAYMPGIVAVYGKVSVGHILSGYLGLTLLAAASLAIGTFGSALTKSQVVAALLSGVMCLALMTCWILVKVVDRPLTDIVGALAYWGHFDPFRQGVIHTKDVAYFCLVAFLALFASTRVLEARRWR